MRQTPQEESHFWLGLSTIALVVSSLILSILISATAGYAWWKGATLSLVLSLWGEILLILGSIIGTFQERAGDPLIEPSSEERST